MTHALPVLGTLDEVRTGKAVPYIQGGGDGGGGDGGGGGD